MLWRQAHAATVPQRQRAEASIPQKQPAPAPSLHRQGGPAPVAVAPPPRSAPVEFDLSSLAPPGRKPLKRSDACIGVQNERERQQAARCVVEGGRMGGAGPADIYLRHSTALVLQEGHTHSSPASRRHDVVGVVLGRDRRHG